MAQVYLLHGEDDFIKEGAVLQLQSVTEPATRDFNLDIVRGLELDPQRLSSLLSTPPLMADRRVVVIREANGLKKDARRELDRYLEQPATDLILVLVVPSGAKPDRGLCEHARVSVVEFRPLVGDEITKWIVHHTRSELHTGITAEAAELLQGSVGNDLGQIASELDKLCSYCGGAEIGADAVEAVVGIRRGETLGDLFDAVAARDARKSLELLPHILQQPKSTGVAIVIGLSTQMLAMAWASAARAEGLPKSRLSGELFDLLKESGSFPMRPWGEAVNAWIRHLDHWTFDALDDALEALLAADIALKESRVSSDEQLLTSLVLTLCAPAPQQRRPAA